MPVLDAEIVTELEIADVRAIHGVTFDGRSIWFAADDGDLVQVDAGSQKVVSRTRGIGVRAGVAFDGTHVWAICGERIDRIDPATRAVVRSIPAPDTHVSGLAWGENALWVGVYRDKKILKLDPADGRILKTIALGRLVTGVSWADGELWHGSVAEESPPTGGGLHRLDPESGAETLELHLPLREGAAGVEYDPTRGVFWVGAHDLAPADGKRRASGKLRAVRKPRAAGA